MKFTFISVLLIVHYLSIIIVVNAQEHLNDKPDLIIQNVSIDQSYLDSKDKLGMPLQNPYKKLHVQIVIKNIGQAEFRGFLYLARTNSRDDALLNLFSVFERVSEGPVVILQKKSQSFDFVYYVGRELKEIKFKINEHPDPQNIQAEEDYFNNIFTVKL